MPEGVLAYDGLSFPPGDLPAGGASLSLLTYGDYALETDGIVSLRPDIFQPGHFSVFDALVRADAMHDLGLRYHYDKALATHVIDSLQDEGGWWYQAYYANGWPESNVFRMDQFPFKNGTAIQLQPSQATDVADIQRTFAEEVARYHVHGGQVILPHLDIRGRRGHWTFEDVLAKPHDLRQDVFQPGVVTALDVLLSMREQGLLDDLELTWYERIGRADPVDQIFVTRINDEQAAGGCGFVYESGPDRYSGFRGAHIHLPSDTRMVLAPEYMAWFWICL